MDKYKKLFEDQVDRVSPLFHILHNETVKKDPSGRDIKDFNIILQVVSQNDNIIPKSDVNIISVTDSKYIYEFYSGIEIKEYSIFKLNSIVISKKSNIPVIRNIEILSEGNDETKSFYETCKNIQIHPAMYTLEFNNHDSENDSDSDEDEGYSPVKKKFKSGINTNDGIYSDIQVTDEFEELLLNEFKEYNIYSCANRGILGSRLNSIAEFNISNYLVKGFNQLNSSSSSSTTTASEIKELSFYKNIDRLISTTISPINNEKLSFIYLLSHLNKISEFNKRISDYKIKNKTINTNTKTTMKEINIRYVYILSLTLLGLEDYNQVENIDKFFKSISSSINTNNNNSLINLVNITLNHSLLAIYNNISSEQSLKLKYNYIDLSKVSHNAPITFEETSLKENYQCDHEIEDEYYKDSDKSDEDDEEFKGIYYSHFEQFNGTKQQQSNNTTGNELIIQVYIEKVSLNIQNTNLFEWNCDKSKFNLITPSLSNGSEGLFYVAKRYKNKVDLSNFDIMKSNHQITPYLHSNFKNHLGTLYSKLNYQDYYFNDGDNDEDDYYEDETFIPIPPNENNGNNGNCGVVSSGCSINPTLSLFKKCFSIYTHGIFDSNFNWFSGCDDGSIQVVVSGRAVTACIDNLPIEIRKEYVWLLQIARLFYKSRLPKFLIPFFMKHVEEASKFKELLYSRYHSPLSEYYRNHNIELSLIVKMEDGDKDEPFVQNGIGEILNQLTINLNCTGKEYTYIRTDDSIIIYYQHPYHSVVIKLQVYHSIEQFITLQSIGRLDCLNAVYDGSNVYMSAGTVHSFNSRYNLISAYNYFKENEEVDTYNGFKSIRWDYNPNNIPCNYYYCHPLTRLFNYNLDGHFTNDEYSRNGYFINNKSIKYNESYSFHISDDRRNKLKDLKLFRPLPNWNQSIKLLKRLNDYHSIEYSSNIMEIVKDTCLILHHTDNDNKSIEQYGFVIKNNCLLCNDGIVHFNGSYSYWCEACLNQQHQFNNQFKSKQAVIILNGYGNIEFNPEGIYDSENDIEINTDYNRQITIFEDYEHYGFRVSLELLQLGFNVTIITVDGNEEIDYLYNYVSDSYEISTSDFKRLKIISTENGPDIDNIELFSNHIISKVPNGIDILINSVYSNNITREEDWQTFENGIFAKQLFSNLSKNYLSKNKKTTPTDGSDYEDQCSYDHIKYKIEFTNCSITYDINGNVEEDGSSSHSLKVYTGDEDHFKQFKIFIYRYCNIDNINNIIDDNNQQFEITREGSIIFIKNNSIPLIDSAISTVNQILKHFITQPSKINNNIYYQINNKSINE